MRPIFVEPYDIGKLLLYETGTSQECFFSHMRKKQAADYTDRLTDLPRNSLHLLKTKSLSIETEFPISKHLTVKPASPSFHFHQVGFEKMKSDCSRIIIDH